MVVWNLEAKSRASTVCPLGDCLFFMHFADTETVVPTAPSTRLMGSHLSLLCPVWSISFQTSHGSGPGQSRGKDRGKALEDLQRKEERVVCLKKRRLK